MRRRLLSVGGLVCALWLAGGTLAGCRSQEPEVRPVLVEKRSTGSPPAAPPPPAPVASVAPEALAARPEAQGAKPEAQPEKPEAQGAKPEAPAALAKKVFVQKPGGGGSALFGSGAGVGALGGVGLRGGGSGKGMGSVQGIGMGSVGRGGGMGVALSGQGLVGRRAAVAPAWDGPPSGSEDFKGSGVNPFVSASEDRLSTFAIDVDTASYTVVRRMLMEGQVPPPEAVRVEEFLNYFRYGYAEPEGSPLAVHMDAAPSPLSPGRHLLRVGVQGRRLSASERKPAHLTFLVDVSGSMQSPDRLPLARRALRLLVDQLRDGDTVALVTYAGGVRLVLPPTGMEHKARIHASIEELSAGGSTAMASGIQLAYQQAMKTLDSRSVSRVIILSDGDANVGPTRPEEILQLIRGYVKEGITVTTVGFGMGNYRDTLMEQFANQGNGNHSYVDSLLAARRIFQEQLGGTLEVIAQDVKLQVEFDLAQVARYRLVGYENRAIADVHFRDDKVDAGELGSGHTVTALYEVELKPGAGEGLATVRVRAKAPRGEEASERAFRFQARALAASFEQASGDFRFATAVMGAAELLRHSPHAEGWSFARVLDIARAATPPGSAERREFVSLLERARPLVARMARDERR